MSAAWFVARTRMRTRWRSWLLPLAILAMTTATAVTLFAGGRRAETVYPRFWQSQNAPDVMVEAGAGIGLADLDMRQVASLPQVAAAAHSATYFSLGRTGAGRLIPPRVIAAMVADPSVFAGGMMRVKILSGRAADPTRPDEIVADYSYQKAFGINVGSTVTVRFCTPAGLPQLFAAINGGTPETLDIGPLLTFRVVGLAVVPGALPPVASGGLPALWMTPAFRQLHAAPLAHTNMVLARLRHGGGDLNAFKSGVEQMAGGKPVLFHSATEAIDAVQVSFRSQALSLYILAGLVAVVAVLFVGQALVREAQAQSGEPALAAIGMTRRQRAAAFAIQGLLAGVVAGLVGAAAALLASPLMPVGLARIADPAPGFSFDAAVVVGGLLLAVVVSGGLAALQGWRAEQREVEHATARADAGFRSIGGWLPVTGRIGLGFAFQARRGRNAVSPRATVTGIALGLLTLTATIVFGGSLTHLVETPHLWGAAWQARVGDGFAVDPDGRVGSGLLSDPWVRDVAAGTAGQLQLDQRVRVDAFAVDVVKGDLTPLVLEGRAPARPDEILLGTTALHSLGARLGDAVTVSVGPASRRLRIVGRGPVPLGAFRDSGQSAMITFQAFRELAPSAQPDIYLVNGPPGTNSTAALDYLSRHHSGIGVFGPELPTDVANFGDAQWLPPAMGAVLVILSVLILAHALVMATRGRRWELGVLKTLGFVRSQVAAAVMLQAVALVTASAAVAIPLGVLTGRWLWLAFANQVGVQAEAVIPGLEIAGLVLAAVAMSVAVAAGPARAASRVSPAVLLRTE